MAQTRKKVRTAIKTVLANPWYGINARYQALLASYGLTQPLAIDWNAGSKNFFQGMLTPASAGSSQLAEYPAVAICTLGTTPTQRAQFELVQARIALVVFHSFAADSADTVEKDDTESELDALEDAAKTALRAAGATWQQNGVIFANDIAASRDPLLLLGDGWEQWAYLDLTFEVELPE